MTTEGHRCPHCDNLLTTAAALLTGECGCRWKHGDIILNPKTNGLLRAEYDKYAKRVEWVELVAIGNTTPRTPDGAVLLCRVVNGRRLPVTDMTNGDLFAVGDDAA